MRKFTKSIKPPKDDPRLRPGTRKSRAKPLREGSSPPGTSSGMEAGVLRGHTGSYPSLLAYIAKHTPLTQANGYSDPANPRNRRVVVNVHRLNETLRHPLTVAELASRLGFRFRKDFTACLNAGIEAL